MKKAHLSPVTSLAVSFSLALGILVSDLAGYRHLTAAYAKGGSHAGHGKSVKIKDGVALDGMEVRGLLVKGQVVSRGLIVGSVRIVDGMIAHAHKVFEDDGTATSGVVVGDQKPKDEAQGDTATPFGVVVGDQSPKSDDAGGTVVTPSGVVVGDQGANEVGLSGVLVINGKGVGGTLTGDGITVNDGVITGENLVLVAVTINGGSAHFGGDGTSVQISPAN